MPRWKRQHREVDSIVLVAPPGGYRGSPPFAMDRDEFTLPASVCWFSKGLVQTVASSNEEMTTGDGEQRRACEKR